MSDYRRPVDELPVKDESTLSLTDTLIGVDAVAEPAAFQAQLGEIAARLVGPIADGLPSDAGFVDELIPLIIGQVVTNANGSYVRFENGLQVCWFQSDTEVPTSGQTVAPWYHTDVTAFTYPATFTSIPAVMPTSRTASNGLGVTVTGASSGSCSLRGWGVNNGQWVRFGYVAVGRWK